MIALAAPLLLWCAVAFYMARGQREQARFCELLLGAYLAGIFLGALGVKVP